MIEGTDYVRSASDVKNMDDRGENYYLKHKVEGTTVTESYVCFVTDTEHCLRGGTDGNSVSYYKYNEQGGNWAVMDSQKEWFYEQGVFFSDGVSDYGCSGGIFNSVMAQSTGSIVILDEDYCYCGVDLDGSSACS